MSPESNDKPASGGHKVNKWVKVYTVSRPLLRSLCKVSAPGYS